MKYAPIIITTLCRSKHFIRLVESLKLNGWAKYTDVYVGLDYPPSEYYRKGWLEICDYIDHGDFSVFASFNVIRRTKNYGASKNLGYLRNLIFKTHDRCISFEDDNEASPNFLEYMDKCLEYFEDDPDVVGVSGYCYPVDWKVSNGSTCMRQDFCASAWGMGVWKNKLERVKGYIRSGRLLDDLPRVIKEKSYEKMIDACLEGYFQKAISPLRRWKPTMLACTDVNMRAYLSVDGKYFVSPVLSKVRNHGFDGSGLYCHTIDSGVDGNTARSYRYADQPIDDSATFDIVLNQPDYLSLNRDRLNKFDYRSEDETKEARRIIWIAKHCGVWVARLYGMGKVPSDIISFIKNKIKKKV
jgi:hypothetical protein